MPSKKSSHFALTVEAFGDTITIQYQPHNHQWFGASSGTSHPDPARVMTAELRRYIRESGDDPDDYEEFIADCLTEMRATDE